MSGLLPSLTILAMFLAYGFSDHPDKECLLFGAVIVAIGHAADRITERIPERVNQ